MSKNNELSPKGLTSPVGKSLLTAFSKTIDRMEARIKEKSQRTVHVDRQEEILRAFKINLNSHSRQQTDSTNAVIKNACDNVEVTYQVRSEAAFMNEHRQICRRAPFHMMFSALQNEGEEITGNTTTSTPAAAPTIEAASDLGRFEDSEHSSEDDFQAFFDGSSTGSLTKTDFTHSDADNAFELDGDISYRSKMKQSLSHPAKIDTDLSDLEHDDTVKVHSEFLPEENSIVGGSGTNGTEIPTTNQRNISLKDDSASVGCKPIAGDQRKPKPMKFHSGKMFSNQTAAEGRQYVLDIIGASNSASLDKITARRFYIESCETQKITPHVSHISKFEGSSATYSSIKDSSTNLKGIGEKRLMAISRFIQDRLKEDGSQLILRESLIGNDGCKILRNLAVDIEIPCKIHTLDLSENTFNVTGIGTLRPLLALSSLRRLILSKLNLGDSGICALMDILCQPAVAASECEGNSLPSPKSPKCSPKSPKISSSRSYQSNVVYLDLSHNAIRTQGANAIARLIQCSKSLVHLELGWNAIGPSGSLAIEKSMQDSSSILFLGLSWNGLDESGGVSMASLIGASKCIQEMDLSNNRISMIATCLISTALRQNTSLKYLNLAGNLVGKTGCKSLFRVIRWQQLYRHSQFLEQIESAKLSQLILNHEKIDSREIVERPAVLINVDACIFEDQMSLDLGLHNCNGVHRLNLKNFRDRAKFAELIELSYVGEPLPSLWNNCTIDGKAIRVSITPSNHVMPSTSGFFEGSFNITHRTCDMSNCIDSSSFSVVLQSIVSLPQASTNVKLAIAMSHFSEFVYFSSQQVRAILSCFDEPEAHYKILLSVYCKTVDIQQKNIFISTISQENVRNIKQTLGQLFDFCAEFPMRHYRIDLSKKFDVDLFKKIQSTSTIQTRYAGSIRLPDTSQYPLIPLCIRNVRWNGVQQKDFTIAYAIPKAGIVELDFTSIMTQIPDRVPSLLACSDASFMKMRQNVYSSISNVASGLDTLASQLETNLYSLTTQQTLFLLALWPPILNASVNGQNPCDSGANCARLDALVCCYSHISDLENLWPTLRSDSEYSWKSIQMICDRIGWLNVWNPLDSDGYYELDLSFRDQKVVCECLVVLSVKEPGENWQDETFNGQRFELPVTWVTEVPDRGIVTLTYTSGLKKRNMLIDIRKQLANRCLIRYRINKLPKNEADMIEEERKMQEMTSNAAAAALAQGYADLAEDDESKELQELILTHTEAILAQEGVIAALQKEMELRMMDDVQKYLELKKKLASEVETLEKQKTEVNIVIEEAKRKVSAEALETFGIDGQDSASEQTNGEEALQI